MGLNSSALPTPALINYSNFDNLSIDNDSSDISAKNESMNSARTTGELVIGTLTFVAITLMTIGGNTLVILSVFTYRPLNRVQNYFLVSLAAADLAVAVLVTPFHIVKFIVGEWIFGLAFCQFWLTMDILCCTASILNLCAIALDRYWAIHDPIKYASKRTLKLVLCMISAVWSLSLLISVPPLIGWNDWSPEHLGTTCELTQHPEFVVYSACGSFFIPLLVMTTVYAKIFYAARQRLRSKRRSLRGLSVGSMADTEHGDRENTHMTRPNSRRSTNRRQCSSRVGGTNQADRMARMSNSATTTCTSTDHSNLTAHSISTTTTCCDDKIPVLTRRNTGILCTVDEQSIVGDLPTFLGLDSSGKRTPDPASEKAKLLKEQNGTTTLFVVTPAEGGNASHCFRTAFDSDTTSTKPLRQQSLHRFVNKWTDRTSIRQANQPRRSEPYILGLPSRGDSVRASISSHIQVEKYMKEKERISVTKEKKAAKTLAVIMGVFVLCWLPFFINYIVTPFIPRRMHPKVEEAITWLGYINSAINPVIYTIFNLDFRRAFQKFLCPFRPQKTTSQSGTTKNPTSGKTC